MISPVHFQILISQSWKFYDNEEYFLWKDQTGFPKIWKIITSFVINELEKIKDSLPDYKAAFLVEGQKNIDESASTRL